MAGSELKLIPARRGRAARLKAGQSIKIINTHGQQVVDTWCFNAEDLREFLSMEHLRPTIERIFARKLDKVLDDYDLILCDCAPNLMTGTQNALYASDWYCIPMQPDYLSSIGLGLLQDRLGYLKKELEFKIRCLGIVFTRVRHWLRYHAETMEKLRADKALQRLHFFDTYIPENIKLAEAPMEAKPIALHDASASGAAAFQALASEIIARLKA